MEPTERVLEKFEQLSQIPRGSGNEAGVRAWLEAWAEERSFYTRADAKGNLAVYVPATPGMEDRPAVILQGHTDMVCQKTADSPHDFTRDPIRTYRDGDYLKAQGTTLGADNGIAVALVMALAEDETVRHPRLELLFTVEEEVGLLGADQIDPRLLTAKTLINLDGEFEGVLTVGCAGGSTVTLTQPATWELPDPEKAAFELTVSGLRGGHSGEDIHRNRGNANKLLTRALLKAQQAAPIQLAFWKGGTARNAIPASATAIFAFRAEAAPAIQAAVEEFNQVVQAEFAHSDSGVRLSLAATSAMHTLCDLDSTRAMLRLMQVLPNGVSNYSAAVSGAVETSNNLGVVEMKPEGLYIVSSQRSAVFSRLQEITARVEAIGALSGAQVTSGKLNPPWVPDLESPLLKTCQQVYERLNGSQPTLRVTHGGLEVGRLSERCGGLDGVSIGVTLHDLHSPDERLYIPSIAPLWHYLTALLQN